jgi:uncharacterized protein (UPF0548 family)
MLLLHRPTANAFDRLLTRWRAQALTYPHEGITRDAGAPRGFAVDHNRIQLGDDFAAFERAVAAMRRWAMFDIPWLALEPRDTPIRSGEIVAIMPRMLGLITVSPCRIVYVIDERSAHRARFGFGYGTLPGHVGRGEERFLIEWERTSDNAGARETVHYDIFAVSQPGLPLTTLGYPMMRLMQKRFARASKRAMLRAVA